MDSNMSKMGSIKQKFPTMFKNGSAFYYAYIYSRIQYGIEVYGKASSTIMKTVQTQQNRALKIGHCITETVVHSLCPSIKILTFYK